jgi:hypothetical protein
LEAIREVLGYLKDNEDDIKLYARKPKKITNRERVDDDYATDKEEDRLVRCTTLLGGMMTSGCADPAECHCPAVEYQTWLWLCKRFCFQQMLLKIALLC